MILKVHFSFFGGVQFCANLTVIFVYPAKPCHRDFLSGCRLRSDQTTQLDSAWFIYLIYICFMMIPWDHDSYHDSDDDHVNLWMINERLWAEEWNSFDEGWLPMITDDYYVWGVNRVCIVASPQRMLVWWVLSSFVPAHVTLRNTWFNLKNPGRNRLKRRFGNPEVAETRKATIMTSGSICQFFGRVSQISNTQFAAHQPQTWRIYTLGSTNIAGSKGSPEWRCM